MNEDFQALRAFNFSDSMPYLWVFKDSRADARFSAFYVQTDEELNNQLKEFVNIEINRITEHSPYTYISQTNENSCLAISYDDTDFTLLKNKVDQLEGEHRATELSNLKGAKGYVVKFTYDGVTVYGVKRSTSTWKTSYPKKYINMIFSNGELTGVEDNSFSVEKNFDFYVINNTIFIANKKGFESAMKYRTAYVEAFSHMQQSPAFSSLFSDITPIIEHVGNNSMHLRRMAVIEEKGLYNFPNFIPNLLRVNDARGWGINFDLATNSIVPCAQTVTIILQVLLDHRLMSEITENIYDVPDATKI